MLLPTEYLETTNGKEKLRLLLIAAASMEVTASKKTQQESNRRNNFDAVLHHVVNCKKCSLIFGCIQWYHVAFIFRRDFFHFTLFSTLFFCQIYRGVTGPTLGILFSSFLTSLNISRRFYGRFFMALGP